MNERLAVGDAPGPDFDDIFALARSLELDEGPAIRNPAVREKLADWYVKTVGLKYTKFRTMTALSRGQTPGPEASITKLVSASKLQEIASYGIDLMGMTGAVMDGEIAPMEAWFQEALLYAPGLRIAGGSDEILRAAARFTGRLRASQDRAVPARGLSLSGFQLAERYVLVGTNVAGHSENPFGNDVSSHATSDVVVGK